MDSATVMDSDEDIILTPPEIGNAAKEMTLNLLPEKSRHKYNMVYKTFMYWWATKSISSFSENVLLVYFGELAEKYKSSSLWAHYSMLRSTISIHNNVKIETYAKLRAFLKRKSEGYEPKKSKTFTPEQINTFLTQAPENVYLATKVALIMGIMGACRTNELHAMKMQDLEDLHTTIVVTVPVTKTKHPRKFTITGDFYTIIKKYISLQPATVTYDSFFLNYQKGKCTCQKIGINKFASMGKQIASFLDLPDAKMYTGHSFRRSSATLLIDAGADVTALKRHGGWKSTTVAEGYIDGSIKNKTDTANKILGAVQGTSSNNTVNNKSNTFTAADINRNTPFSIINYGTVNVYVNKND